MNGKVTVVIGDDTDDETLTVYGVNEEGVIVIFDDDCATTDIQHGSEDPNVRKNTQSACSKDKIHVPSTSNDNKSTSQPSSDSLVDSTGQLQDPNIDIKKCQSPSKSNQTNQSPCKTNQTSLPNKKRLLPSNTFSHSNAASNANNNSNPSASLLNNQNKSLCSSTDNQHNPPLLDNQGCFESTTKRHVSKDSNFTVTIENNLSDKRKANFHSPNILAKDSCSSQAPNKDGHSSQERGRTKSAPSSTSGKERCDSSLLGVVSSTFDKHKTNSNSTSASCSTEVKSDNGKSHSTHKRSQTQSAPTSSSQKRKHKNSPERENPCSRLFEENKTNSHISHKKPRMQSAPASMSTLPQTSVASSSRQVLSNLQNPNLPTDSLENLSTFLHVIFIDLDNWGKFFSLPYSLPPKVFVWGFCGGNYSNKHQGSVHFRALVREKRFFQHPMCGKSKNAADFALCVQAARLDLQLPKHIPFTVLSGDKGFGELKTQLSSSERQIHLVDPHHEEQDMLYATLASIGQA
ncbi:zinc finger 451 S homeolog isoform X2 [Paramuricea clavata]|uniref:Zinc finger 451 S homeolog isoform X2 n=1 Tax=Paramuricea clavata TaxID=317549 RepID=A0A6S7J8E8_PARCT|nr:zinc finger 451 S homeolog isoform X2 [Paramuricea clavata]